MRPVAVLGLVLILAGIVALAYQRINYTTRETVVDIGPIHATADKHKSVACPRRSVWPRSQAAWSC